MSELEEMLRRLILNQRDYVDGLEDGMSDATQMIQDHD